MTSRIFSKLKSGEQRLFRKADEGGHRLYGKMKSQVFNNPRFMHSVGNALGQVSKYGSIGAGLASGAGQPEIAIPIAATSAILGKASNLLNDRGNYLEKRRPKAKEEPGTQFH